MTETGKYIAALLTDHDCVIVPGLGGFILQEQQGRYDVHSHKLFPPSKKISFNALLNNDDGLFIHHICEERRLDYTEGKDLAREFTVEVLEQATTEDGALIEPLGRLYFTAEGQLSFSPKEEINWLNRSYGLTPLYAQPIAREVKPPSARSIKPRIDRRPDRPEQKLKTPATVKWAVGVALPVILFLLWGIIFPANFQQNYASYSGILTDIFSRDVPPTHPDLSLPAENNSTTGIRVDETPVEKLQKEPVTSMQDENTSSIQVDEAVTEAVAKPAAPELIYHVIGGVFRSEDNAERYVDALKGLGYHSRLVGMNGKGLYRVSYESFATWTAAESFLDSIKEKENPSAWILKY